MYVSFFHFHVFNFPANLGKPYETFNLESALALTHNCLLFLDENEQAIHHDVIR